MGWVLFRMGRYEEALEYLERANDALLDEEVISHLAETLHVLGRTDEAREVLAQGLEDLPDSDMIPETRARLGLDD
jgi:tetratricopeptide (TPR) repeat protein